MKMVIYAAPRDVREHVRQLDTPLLFTLRFLAAGRSDRCTGWNAFEGALWITARVSAQCHRYQRRDAEQR